MTERERALLEALEDLARAMRTQVQPPLSELRWEALWDLCFELESEHYTYGRPSTGPVGG